MAADWRTRGPQDDDVARRHSTSSYQAVVVDHQVKERARTNECATASWDFPVRAFMSRDRSLGPDRQKNRTRTNSGVPTSRLSVAAGERPSRCTTCAGMCFSMNVASTDLLRCYGRSPRGARLHDHTPCSHVRRTRHHGLTPRRTQAARRLRWAESRHRRSRLRGTSPGAAPAMWSCSITSPCTSSRTSEMRLQPSARACGFLPPYSPDFNPIEQLFAKLQAFLRAARLRSFDHVCRMRASIALFTADECASYVRHSGYRLAPTA